MGLSDVRQFRSGTSVGSSVGILFSDKHQQVILETRSRHWWHPSKNMHDS